MTTAIDQATTPLQTVSTPNPAKAYEGRSGAQFAQHLEPVPKDGLPAVFATLIDPRGADFLLKENERAAQHEAMQEFGRKSSANGEDMGLVLEQMRRFFADMGVPIVDMVDISRSPDGTYHVKGWGKGEAVSHPQAKFLEAILNGQAPGLEELSAKVVDLIDKVEALFAQSQDLRENYAPLTGRSLGDDYQRLDSIFDAHFIMGTEHTDQIKKEARELSMRFPEHFQAFKDSQGAELGKLGSDQILSRYYFDTVMLPKLQKALPDYFA